MRRLPTAVPSLRWGALALAWCGGLPACLAAPTQEDLLAIGFRTPEQAFATFQTALRGDLVDLEYRSLSGGFKRANGVSQLVYETARERLFEEQPLIRLAARAEVTERVDMAPDRVRLTARVETLFVDSSFSVLLVREDYYETFDREGLLEDDYAPWSGLASVVGEELRLTLPMPEGTSLDEIVEVRAGREWKLDGFEPEPTPPDP